MMGKCDIKIVFALLFLLERHEKPLLLFTADKLYGETSTFKSYLAQANVMQFFSGIYREIKLQLNLFACEKSAYKRAK